MAKKGNPEKLLKKAYDIISGIACEQGPEGLSRYGDPSVLDEIADFLGIGGDGKFYAVEYTSTLSGKPEKKWGVCLDPANPDDTWVITGFASKDEAVQAVKDVEPGAEFGNA